MKKNSIILIPILLISIFLAYRTESVEMITSNILEVMYTYDYKDYRNIEAYKEFNRIDITQSKRLRNYFTEEGFESILLNQSMTKMLRFTQAYNCDSSVDSLNIIVEDTENKDVRVAKYDVIIVLDFIDEEIGTLYFDLSGSMTLYKDGMQWKINHITNNRRFYQRMERVLREL